MSNETPSPSEREPRLYLQDSASEIPWRKIVGTRNRVMHACPGVDLSTSWLIATVDVPLLRQQLPALLQRS